MPNLLMPDVSSYADPEGNKRLATASNDPNAALTTASNALGVANQGLQLQRQQVSLSSEQIALGRQKLAAQNEVFGSIGADPTSDNAQQQMIEALKAGKIDSDSFRAGAAQLMPLGGDPQKIKQWAFQHLAANASYDQQLQNMGMQAPTLVNTGGQLKPMTSQSGLNPSVNPAGGGTVPLTTTPGEKMGGLTVKNSDGSSTFRPNSTLYDDKGNFLGAGGTGSAPSIPVYRGGSSVPAPAAGGSGQGAAPSAPAPVAAPAAPQGSAPAGGPAAPGGQGAATTGMWTPGPQTMPVVTLEQAQAAAARTKTPQGTAADRNLLRGYAVQNNIPLQGSAASTWEPQPGQAPQTAGQGQGGAPAAPAPAGGAMPPGRQPPASQPTGAQPQGQQAGAGQGSFGSRFGGQSGQDGGGLTVGLSPGQEASLKAGADGYSSLSSDVSNPSGVNQRLFQLRTALGALRNTQTGLGTAQRQQLVGYLASLPGGLAKWAPGVDPDSASAYDIASKYLTAYSLNTPGAARSDAGLSTAQSANANTSGMMQKAAQDVTLSNIGLENGKRALLNSFNASGADPGTFTKFASQWMQNTDPRAFALPDMTPAERGQLYGGLQGPAKAAFLATVKKGLAAKILTPNDLQGAAGNGQ